MLLLSLEQEAELDPDLQELSLLETRDICEEVGYASDKLHIINGCLEKEAVSIAQKIFGILDTHYHPRSYNINTDVEMYIEKIYHVSQYLRQN